MDREFDGAAAADGSRAIGTESRERPSGLGRSLEAYAHDWLAAYDAALSGEYGPQRLVSDMARTSARLVRDMARLYVSGFEILKTLAHMPTSARPTGGDLESGGPDSKNDLSKPARSGP